MSHIINISVDLREYMQKNAFPDISYFPVSKRLGYIRKGDGVVLWSSREPKGIYGYGEVVKKPTKPGKIKRKLYDRNHLHIGIKFDHVSFIRPILPESIARQLPSINERKQPVVIANSLNYWGYGIYSEVATFMGEFNHLFNAFAGYTTLGNYKYVLHLLRERHLIANEYRAYWIRLEDSPLVCTHCQVDFEKKPGRELARRMMELHESTTLQPDKYEKIDASCFDVVCPNCHKLAHEKIRAEGQRMSNSPFGGPWVKPL